MKIRHVTARDEQHWRHLFKGYNAFYQASVPEDVVADLVGDAEVAAKAAHRLDHIRPEAREPRAEEPPPPVDPADATFEASMVAAIRDGAPGVKLAPAGITLRRLDLAASQLHDALDLADLLGRTEAALHEFFRDVVLGGSALYAMAWGMSLPLLLCLTLTPGPRPPSRITPVPILAR